MDSCRHQFTLTALNQKRSSKAISILISLVDTKEKTSVCADEINSYDSALQNITGIYLNDLQAHKRRDSNWWRMWWQNHKKFYPVAIQTKSVIHNTH